MLCVMFWYDMLTRFAILGMSWLLINLKMMQILSVSCVSRTQELIDFNMLIPYDVSVGVLRWLNFDRWEAILCFTAWHCGKTSLRCHLISYDFVITNVLKYSLAVLNFIVVPSYFWNCFCLVFCSLVHNIQHRFRQHYSSNIAKHNEVRGILCM